MAGNVKIGNIRKLGNVKIGKIGKPGNLILRKTAKMAGTIVATVFSARIGRTMNYAQTNLRAILQTGTQLSARRLGASASTPNNDSENNFNIIGNNGEIAGNIKMRKFAICVVMIGRNLASIFVRSIAALNWRNLAQAMGKGNRTNWGDFGQIKSQTAKMALARHLVFGIIKLAGENRR